MVSRESIEKEEEQKIIQFLEDEIIKSTHLEFTLSEIEKGTDLGSRKADNALTRLEAEGKVTQKDRGKNNASFYTISYLFKLCKDWLVKNKNIK